MAEAGNNEFPTILGKDAKFKGELTFEQGMRLHGQFEGKITTTGKLHITREARMEAEVEAGSIVVEGHVQGNLTASDRVELKSTANYSGDLCAAKLVVEEGASFNGHVTVGPEAVKGASRPQTQSRAGGGNHPAMTSPQAAKLS